MLSCEQLMLLDPAAAVLGWLVLTSSINLQTSDSCAYPLAITAHQVFGNCSAASSLQASIASKLTEQSFCDPLCIAGTDTFGSGGSSSAAQGEVGCSSLPMHVTIWVQNQK